jgi:hypothetical protein
MTYYSPGIEYHCPRCESCKVGFIIENKYKKWLDTMKLINHRKIKLSNLYNDYKKNPDSVKWMCYGCRDCGVVLKNN